MDLKKLSKKELVKLIGEKDKVIVRLQGEAGRDSEDDPGDETPDPRSKSVHQLRIEEFMIAGEQEVPGKPVVPSREVRRLRAKLVLEEALELAEALGCFAEVVGKAVTVHASLPCDLVRVADGCADLSVVTLGTLSACGIADNGVLSEVDSNNLTKVADSGTIAKDRMGKILKPKGWTRPKLGRVLLDQGYGSIVDEPEAAPVADVLGAVQRVTLREKKQALLDANAIRVDLIEKNPEMTPEDKEEEIEELRNDLKIALRRLEGGDDDPEDEID